MRLALFLVLGMGIALAGDLFPDAVRVDTDGNGMITQKEWAAF